MAIDRKITPKAPTQKPTDFYQSKQQGGAYGKPEKVGERLKGGPMREKMGRKGL
ncbi:hypothetical protein B0G75_104266 [Paraburkholderia sp. BL18I3N2]|uniref:hypothetical protein n=1 Tax=unclassified Paraburkholderia TaxID=2615204 RepID=UPI000D4FA729|nr:MULTISPECIES: hypothetical protein [unclassified Paraburkholderia]PRX32245.1 hypothetical protein B0G75_104266 [Paraburkholderia sp. BL18I3N2]PRY07059.1 hypothetical protein B0G73_105201 [Paraburkholderia sp. BL25I1N1]